MKRSQLKILICLFFAVILVLSLFPTFMIEAEEINSFEKKAYNGPKYVFESRDKPDGTPGDGPKGKPPKPPKPPEVDKWAVIIGIADYRGVGNDLLYPDDDAIDMYNYLISKGYPDDNIKLLLNRKATARNILKAINWLNDKENDIASECVFFYSGHGSTYDGYNDGDDEDTDEGIVTNDMYLILDGQLRDKFSTFTSEKIAFVFDCCFSGGMDDLIGEHTQTTFDGRVVSTACDEDEYSYDGSSTMQNGVFSYYFIEGIYLENNIDGAHGYATPLAHDWVLANYYAQMNPQLYDTYTGDWSF